MFFPQMSTRGSIEPHREFHRKLRFIICCMCFQTASEVELFGDVTQTVDEMIPKKARCFCVWTSVCQQWICLFYFYFFFTNKVYLNGQGELHHIKSVNGSWGVLIRTVCQRSWWNLINWQQQLALKSTSLNMKQIWGFEVSKFTRLS